MQFTTIPKKLFEILYMDHFGSLQQTEDNFKFIFIVDKDAFTRFTNEWLHPTKSMLLKEAIDFLKILFNISGLRKEVISNRGIAFTFRSMLW